MQRKFSNVVLIGLLSSLFFLFIFLHGFLFNIDLPLAGDNDIASDYFLLENNFIRLSQLDFSHLFETRMFYPLKFTLAFGESRLGQALLGLPVYLITKNIFISSHFILLLNFLLSFLFMYLLSFRFTRHLSESILSALIYTYHPFVWSQFPDHIVILTLQWLPLIFLLVESLFARVRTLTIILLATALFMQFLSSFYHMFSLVIILPIYIGIRIRMEKLPVRHFLKAPLIISAIALILFGYLYLKPFIESKSTYNVARSLQYITLFSARFSDFLFAPPENNLYGWMAGDERLNRMRHPWIVLHSTEHNLFPGIIVFILASFTLFVCILNLRRKSKQVVPFLIIFGLSLILMLGPYIHIGDLKLPSLYLILYNIIPFSDALRVPTRFMFMAYLSLGVLMASVLSLVSGRLSKVWPAIFTVLVVLIIFEYRTQLPKPYIVQNDVLQFYSWLDSQNDIKVILELPIGNGIIGDKRLERPMHSDNRYLFLALFHRKLMVNGYNSFIPPAPFELGNLITDEFPSAKTISMLKNMGVDLVIIHKDEYYDPHLADEIIKKMEELKLTRLFESDPIYGFALN